MKIITNTIGFLMMVTSMYSSADVEVANELVKRYATIAKMEDSSYAGPSAEEGKAFFERKVIQFRGGFKKSAEPIACASCHTNNPADTGKHIVTGKMIKPLSPAINPKRFDDIEKVEKQFNKHCHEVVGSDCTAAEKASYIAFLIGQNAPSVKK